VATRVCVDHELMTVRRKSEAMLEQIIRRRDAVAADGDARLTIRHARPGDGAALERLAVLDTAPVPTGPVLVAEVGDELWAAVSVSDGSAVADPFRPTAELVWVMQERARRERRRPRPWRGRRIPVPALGS
jgi:hypothetical protein